MFIALIIASCMKKSDGPLCLRDVINISICFILSTVQGPYWETAPLGNIILGLMTNRPTENHSNFEFVMSLEPLAILDKSL